MARFNPKPKQKSTSFINNGSLLIIIRSGSIIRIWPIAIIITTFLYNIFNLGEKKKQN